MPCGSKHQLRPPWGPVSLAAAFSPLSSLASGLPCSWADAGRGRAPPAPGPWRLTPQSHRANKSSQCPLPPGSLSVLALQAALAGASPHSPSSPTHPSPGEGLLDHSSRSFQACCQLCLCWRRVVTGSLPGCGGHSAACAGSGNLPDNHGSQEKLLCALCCHQAPVLWPQEWLNRANSLCGLVGTLPPRIASQ